MQFHDPLAPYYDVAIDTDRLFMMLDTRGIQLKELAHITGYSSRSLNRIFTGKRPITRRVKVFSLFLIHRFDTDHLLMSDNV